MCLCVLLMYAALKKTHGNVRLSELLVPLMGNQPVATLHMTITLSGNTSGMFFRSNQVLVRVPLLKLVTLGISDSGG